MYLCTCFEMSPKLCFSKQGRDYCMIIELKEQDIKKEKASKLDDISNRTAGS